MSRGKVVVGIQARMNSTRLPGKVLRRLGDRSLIEHIAEVGRRAPGVDEAWVVTGQERSNRPIVELCSQKGIPLMTGDDEDVQSRYAALAVKTGAGIIVRLTGDNPLVSSEEIGRVVEALADDPGLHYAANCLVQEMPLGLNVEAFTVEALRMALVEPTACEKEHVTWRFKTRKEAYRTRHLPPLPGLRWPELRLTVDDELDYRFLSGLYDLYGERIWDAFFLLEELRRRPELIINSSVVQKVPR